MCQSDYFLGGQNILPGFCWSRDTVVSEDFEQWICQITREKPAKSKLAILQIIKMFASLSRLSVKEEEGAIKNILMTDVNNPRLLSQDGNL